MNRYAFLSRRIRQYWSLWLILFSGALLSVMLLALGPALADTVVRLGLTNRLLAESDTTANIRLSTRIAPDETAFAALDEQVRLALAERLGDVVDGVVVNGQTSPFYPWQGGALRSGERVTLRFYDEADTALPVTFLAGSWEPAGSGSAIPVVVSEATANHFDLAVGAELPLSQRERDSAPTHTVVVSGIIRPDDGSARYWFGRFTPLRPYSDTRVEAEYSLLVPTNTFFSSAGAALPENDVFLSWYILINQQLSLEDAAALTLLIRDWREATLQQGSLRVDTSLDDLLEDYLAQAAIVRPPLLLLLGLVVMIGIYFVLLVGTQLLIIMRPEFARLHSRGASLRQLFGLQITEALTIVLVSALMGPLLAWLLVLLLARLGPLAAVAGADAAVVLPAGSWSSALLGALLVLVSLLLPVPTTLRQSVIAAQNRAEKVATWQRYYLDIFLLVLGLILLWRLELFGSFIGALSGTTSVRIDWLLILAPLLLLLALTTIMARLFPPLLALAAGWAGKARGLAAALALWHAARNPVHVTRLLLLIAIATGLGIIASSLNSTLTQNERDRAAFTTGSAYRLLHESPLPGASEGSAVWRSEGQLDIASRRGEQFALLAVEPEALLETVEFRSDFASRPMPELLAELQQALPAPYADFPFNPVPGQPEQMELHLHFHDPSQQETISRLNIDVKLLTAQGDYQLVHLLPGAVPEEPDWVTFAGPVPALPDEAYPLQLVSIWIRTGDSAWLIPPQALAIDDLMAIAGGEPQRITGFEPADGERWEPLDITLFMHQSNLFVRSGRSGLEFSFGYQLTAVGYWYGFLRWGSNNAGALPALVTPRFLEATGLSVGDTAATRISSGATSGWRPIRLRIAGVVDAFPTLADGEPAGSVIVWQTPLLARLNAETHSTILPNERWLASPPTAAQLAAADTVLAIDPILQELRAQPMAVGLRTVTSLGFWMAILFCIAGIGSYLYLTLRQNEAQYAVLRALGMSERQLYAALSLEQIILILTGLLFGTGVGWLLSQLLLNELPLQIGDALTKPEFVVVIDWGAISLVYLAVLLALGLTVLMTIGLLRRQQLQGALRGAGSSI